MSSASSFPTTQGLQDVQDSSNINFGGQNYKSNVNYTLTDHGIVGDAINFAEDVLDLFSEESESNRALLGQGVAAVINQSNKNQTTIVNAAAGVAKYLRREQEDNRAFLAQGTQELLNQSRAQVGALQASFDGALGKVGEAVDKSFSLIAGAQTHLADQFKINLNGLTAFAGDLLKSSDARNTENISAVREAVKTDTGKAMDKIIYLTGAALAVVLLLAYIKR